MATETRPTVLKHAATGTTGALVGFVLAGSGLVPPLIVNGDDPHSSEWVCEAIGPILDAQMVCRLRPAGADGGAPPVVSTSPAKPLPHTDSPVGWEPKSISTDAGVVTVMSPIFEGGDK